MRLSKLEITNFRGIKKSEIYFKQHQVILGQNNSGKSTIMDAIGMLLGRDRLVRSLGDYDFFGGTPQPEDRIIIKGLLTGFIEDSPERNPDWFNDHNGGIPMWFNEVTGEITAGDRPENTILAIQVAFCARFDHEGLEYETLRYFDLGDETDPFENSSLNALKNHTHLKEIGYFLVPSKRTWEGTISFNSELFRRVLKFQEAIPGETVINLRNSLRVDSHKIEEQEPLKDIIQRLNSELSGFINSDGSGISFLPTKGDIEGVLEALTPYIQGRSDTLIPLAKHGSGLISLQTLLLLLEFGRFRSENHQNFFLCAEEPELHLQPGIHRRLVGRIRGLGNQSIITTHSPEIASYYKPEEILVINNSNGELHVSPLLKDGLSATEANAISRLYTIYRKDVCEALMNDKVIIPEGLTEYKWCKLLTNISITAEGWEAYHSVDEQTKSFGIIPTQSSHVKVTYEKLQLLFNEIIPLVDGDSAGNDYVSALKNCATPPKKILRLGDDKELEDVIHWIVNPSASGRVEVLEEISSLGGRTFRELLEKNKSYDAYHESLAEFIMTEEDCVKKARVFINSIHSNNHDNDTNWIKNENKSTATTFVYDFSYPEING